MTVLNKHCTSSSFASTVLLAIPMVLSRLLELLLPTHDFMMVGRYSSVEMGYRGIGWASWALTYVIAMGLISGASVLFSQAEGKGAKQITDEVLHAGFLLAAISGFVIILIALQSQTIFEMIGYDPALSAGAARVFEAYAYCMPFFLVQIHCAQYLGAQRHPWPEVIAMIISVVVNTSLNLGAEHLLNDVSSQTIAFCTSIARGSGATFLLTYVMWGRRARCQAALRFSLNVDILKKLLRLGGPLAFSFGFESASYFVLALFAAALGIIEVAGFQAGMNTLNLIYMVSMGIGLTAGIQSGRALGASDMALLRKDTLNACLIGAGLMAMVSALIFIFPLDIASIYSKDPDVTSVVATSLLIASTYLVFEAVQVILKMALRGIGDIWVPLWIMTFSFWLVGIPTSWVLAFRMGWSVDGLFVGIGVAMVLACSLNAVRFISLTHSQLRTLV